MPDGRLTDFVPNLGSDQVNLCQSALKIDGLAKNHSRGGFCRESSLGEYRGLHNLKYLPLFHHGQKTWNPLSFLSRIRSHLR